MKTFMTGMIIGTLIGVFAMVMAVTIALDSQAVAVAILDKTRKSPDIIELCRKARIGGRKQWENFPKH